jgi:hypothetical protein
LKCIDNSWTRRNRVLNAAINIKRLLNMELDRNERLAYLKLGVRERKRKRLQ